MNFQLTICQSCGRPVHTAPGICVLCGAVLGPVFTVQVTPKESKGGINASHAPHPASCMYLLPIAA